MTQASKIFDIEIAGISIRLNFLDPMLGQEFVARTGSGLDFNPKGKSKWPDPARSGASPKFTPPEAGERAFIDVKGPSDSDLAYPLEGWKLEGNDEYDGFLNPKTGRGWVKLKSAYPLEALANFLRQLLMRLIPANNGLLFHAACVVRNSHTYIFSGQSGTGKSTVCDLSPDCVIVSDDFTAIRRIKGSFHAWGLPSPAVRSPAIGNQRGPLEIKALFVLVQDSANHLVPLAVSRAAARVLALPRTPVEPRRITKMLKLLDELTDRVPCYELRFRKDPSFWECIDKEFASSNLRFAIEKGNGCEESG